MEIFKKILRMHHVFNSPPDITVTLTMLRIGLRQPITGSNMDIQKVLLKDLMILSSYFTQSLTEVSQQATRQEGDT